MYYPLILLYVAPILDKSYSFLSLVNGIYACMFNMDQMVQFLFINQLASTIGFHATYFGDNAIFRKFSNFYSYFWIQNFIDNFLPLIYYGWYIKTHSIQFVSPYIGIVTLMYQLLWMYRVSGSFRLDGVYRIKAPPTAWAIGWAAGSMSHLILPYLMG